MSVSGRYSFIPLFRISVRENSVFSATFTSSQGISPIYSLFVATYRYTITKYELNKLPITIVKEDLIRQRVNGNYDPMALSWAETIRDADRIVIAAPFWDCLLYTSDAADEL